MIAKLTGIIDGTFKDSLIIDVSGVGYYVFCSARTLAAVDAKDTTVSLYIETHVREDHIHLYGFFDQYEQAWFKLLTTVQGVGAKVALAMLSVIAPDGLAQAIAAQDKAVVAQAPGVGPKLALRIITELKDKLAAITLDEGVVFSSTKEPSGAVENGKNVNAAKADAISALVNLGYGRSESFAIVVKVLQRLGPDAGVQAIIKEGLVELSASNSRD